MTNTASKIAKLKQISKINGTTFQMILYRYFHESVMRRLGQSNYQNNFILKGGNLIYVWHGILARPTVDIDFLGASHSNEVDIITSTFQEILCLESEDGVIFDVNKINNEIINEHNNYHGVRLIVPTQLSNIKQNIKIDIGFGDVVIPRPMHIEYPNLLSENSINVLAYSIETVIAEKFHAMVSMPKINSRMKDFYDVNLLFAHPKLNHDLLFIAITETFKNRNTFFESDMILFSEEYQNDPARNKMYEAFLNKLGIKDKQTFAQVTKNIFEILHPFYQSLESKTI